MQLRLLWWRKMLETLRTPTWLVMGFTTPLLYLALFAPLLHQFVGGPGFRQGSILDTFLPGILTLLAFTAGTGAGWLVIAEQQTGVLDRLLVTPTHRLTLLAGQVLRDVVTFVVPAAIVILIAQPLGYHPDAAGIVLELVLLSIVAAATSAWSTALGLTLRDIGALAAVVTGLQLPILLLSGILLPLSLAPDWLWTLAHVDPLYYVVQAARDLSRGDITTPTAALGFLVAITLAALITTWATRSYRTSTS
jgi:ABC-2 type transport system permease protein